MSEFINIDLDENSEEIVLKPTFYSMPQVCDEIDEVYSTVRYWLNMFGDYLEADLSERNKKFSSRDVELLKFIKKMLKNDGFTIKQVQEYLKNNIESFDSKVVIESPEANQMMLQKVIQNEIAVVKEEIVTSVVQQLSAMIVQLHEESLSEMKYELATTLQESLGEKIESTITNEMTSKLEQLNCIDKKLDKAELKSNEHMEKITSALKENMELRRRLVELEEKSNRSFFKRLFNK